MKTLSTAMACLFVVGCAGAKHYHPDYDAQYAAEDSPCNYVMKVAPRACSIEHDDRTKGAIKSWSSSERLTSTDLNGNFNHIHSLMVGGHGGRLVDADVNASANISASKTAFYRGIPRAWAVFGDNTVGGPPAACTSNPCSIKESYNVTSVGWTSTGIYTVTLAYTPTDAYYGVLITPGVGGGVAVDLYCALEGTGTAAPQFNFRCRNNAGTLTDATATFIVMDGD